LGFLGKEGGKEITGGPCGCRKGGEKGFLVYLKEKKSETLPFPRKGEEKKGQPSPRTREKKRKTSSLRPKRKGGKNSRRPTLGEKKAPSSTPVQKKEGEKHILWVGKRRTSPPGGMRKKEGGSKNKKPK